MDGRNGKRDVGLPIRRAGVIAIATVGRGAWCAGRLAHSARLVPAPAVAMTFAWTLATGVSV
jgi:hypothetical protein